MEKEINKFKDIAMVIIKEKYRKPKTKLENLLSNSPENIFVSAFSNYTHYDLYINEKKLKEILLILTVNIYLMQKHTRK